MVIAINFDGTLAGNNVYPYASKPISKKFDLKK